MRLTTHLPPINNFPFTSAELHIFCKKTGWMK